MTSRSAGLLVAAGALVTAAAFVTGHFAYGAGNHKLGYTTGVLAFTPLALCSLAAWRLSGQNWARRVFWWTISIWIAMVLFTLM